MFENIQYGRVAQAVVIILGISLAIFFAVIFAFMFVRIAGVMDEIDPDAPEEEQQERLREETDAIVEEFQEGSPVVTNVMAVQWGLLALVTLVVALLSARHNATSPMQATGYGLVIGLSVLLLYGLFCMCGVPTDIGVKLAFMVAIPAAGAVGGQLGGQRLSSRPATPDALPRVSGAPASPAMSADVSLYYNMGVQAALGGRREEARQHFSRVLQAQPRNVAAWLQLANLADTPQDAWQYVQQARAINPSDAAVLKAVDIIWPQVAESTTQQGPPISNTPGEPPAQRAPRVPGSALDDIFDEAPAPTPAALQDAEIAELPTYMDLPKASASPPAEIAEAPTMMYDVSAEPPDTDVVEDDGVGVDAPTDVDLVDPDALPPPPPPPPPTDVT